MAIPQQGRQTKKTAPPPKKVPTDIFGLYKAAEESSAPDAMGMVRSLAEAEHSLGIARKQREMHDHIRARKAAKGK